MQQLLQVNYVKLKNWNIITDRVYYCSDISLSLKRVEKLSYFGQMLIISIDKDARQYTWRASQSRSLRTL